jgi:CRISPR/Cas system CMR-associated protein Cmr3 (group 5 of RAMP superfamily)
MTKDQLIKIAQVAFPERVKQFINFENAEIHSMSGVHRLYDKDTPFVLMLPKECYLSIFIGENKFIQIQVEHKAFNHYAAIKEMERLGLV